MSTKVTYIIDNPSDPAAFEAAYPALEDSVKQFPNLQRYEAGKVWPKEDGTPTPAYRTLDLYFNSYDDASAAVATAEAADFKRQLAATGTTFTGLFLDVQES